MPKDLRVKAAVMLLLLPLPLFGASGPDAQPMRTIREERHMRVGDKDEIWRLEWDGNPSHGCMPKDPVDPKTEDDYDVAGQWCSGIDYCELGARLFLTRSINGQVIDELEIKRIDGDQLQDGPCLPKWPMYEGDGELYSKYPWDKFIQEVRLRPLVDIMRFHDYNHDGLDAEFVLFAGWGSAGDTKHYVLIGLPSPKSKLQVFGTVENPSSPIKFGKRSAWEKVRAAKLGEPVITKSCDGSLGGPCWEYEVVSSTNGFHMWVSEMGSDGKIKPGSRQQR